MIMGSLLRDVYHFRWYAKAYFPEEQATTVNEFLDVLTNKLDLMDELYFQIAKKLGKGKTEFLKQFNPKELQDAPWRMAFKRNAMREKAHLR